jgi:hypothetical protein
MTITVSISEFRQNISSYLAKLGSEDTIVLKNEKNGEEIAEITGIKKWDPIAFKKALRQVAGTITAKNHPEWRTKQGVIRWFEKSRKAAERTF